MIKTFCDRCGKEITLKEEKGTLTYRVDGSVSIGSATISELCADCYSEFLEWMENKK